MVNFNSSSNNILKLAAVIAGSAVAAASVAFVVYNTYKRFNLTKPKNLILLAEQKKKEGNDLYRQKKYIGAIQLFKEAVAILKEVEDKYQKEIISNCFNNISACYEILNDYESSIKYCSDAIKINPKYVKVLNRRARLHEKLEKFDKSLEDYFTIIPLCSTEDQYRSLNLDVDRVLEKAIAIELNETFEKIKTNFKPIPQYVVANWLWNTMTYDPIVKRIEKINSIESIESNSLDSVLLLLKTNKFDEVLPLLLKIVKKQEGAKFENEEIRIETDEEKFEKIFQKGALILLVARFYYYHNQLDEAHEYVKKFSDLCDSLGKFFDSINIKYKNLDENVLAKMTDLCYAYYTLMVTISKSDEDAKEYIQKALAIESKNTDSLVAYAVRFLDANNVENALKEFKNVLEINSEHVFAKYYIIYLEYIIALKNQAIDRVRTLHYEFDTALSATSNPPIFALLLFTKLCINSENGELALQTAKKVLKLMPNNAYALYLCGVLECDPVLDISDAKKIKDYVDKVEKIMEKVIKIDPNYWETYRTLGKISLDKMKFEEAVNFYKKAIPLTRTREDLEMVIKDKYLTVLTSQSMNNKSGFPFTSLTMN